MYLKKVSLYTQQINERIFFSLTLESVLRIKNMREMDRLLCRLMTVDRSAFSSFTK